MRNHFGIRQAMAMLLLLIVPLGCTEESGSTQISRGDDPPAPWAPPVTEPVSSGVIRLATTQGGVLEVSPKAVDFGEVAPASLHPATFTLANKGSVPITIVSAQPSCACTTISDLDGKVIAPGGTIDLDAALVAPRQPIEKTSKVFIRIEGIQQPVIVELKGDTTLPIKAIPPYAEALKGTTTGTISLRSMDGQPFTVLSSNGEKPVFVGFNSTKDPIRSDYQVAWSIAGLNCESIPRWWVFETDRADCPLVPCRVRNECTGSKRDESRFLRYWIFADYLLDGGVVRAGEPFEVEVDLTHMNPRGGGKVVAPQWSKVLSAEATTSEAVASLAGVTVVDAENARVRLKVVPRKDLRGLLYVPVKVTTATGSGVVDVIAKVIP